MGSEDLVATILFNFQGCSFLSFLFFIVFIDKFYLVTLVQRINEKDF